MAIEVKGKQKNLEDKKGDRIVLEMEEGWAGEEIIVMPYLNKPTKDVAAKTKVEYPVTLHFDGKFLLLRVARANEILRFSYKAVSGRPDKDGKFDYSKERQGKKNEGPIPDGKYHINPQEIQYYEDISLYDKMWCAIGQGPFPGGTDSWGIGRVWIYPKKVTVKGIARNDFSIHGGTEPGSAGCIDLTNNDKDFFDNLTKYRGKITKISLTVRY